MEGHLGKNDKRVDAYIIKSADFAKPILSHLRELVHVACPDVEETMKWSFPHFDYKGMMCSMASFKHHCAFTFWKASLMSDKKRIFADVTEKAMGHLGQIQRLADLPSDKVMIAYIEEAAELNDKGVKLPSKARASVKKKLRIPASITAALKKNTKAMLTFEAFSNSHKNEYVEWIAEAKTEQTRSKRLATMLEWLAEGKSRNWEYVKK